MPILHITNGDSTRAGLERSSVPGTFSSWSDVLHEGPIPANVSAEEWRRVRVAYLESQYGGREAGIAEKYQREDAAFDRWAEYDEVVLWFEHDLYDQLLLIRHLAWMGARGAGREARTRVSLVCDDTYLGPLSPEQFPPRFALREPITEAQIELATAAWTAICSDDPRALLPFASTLSPALPFLAGALQRYLEEFPSADNGLARSEDEILRTLARQGDTAPDYLFAAVTRSEERIFMGDASFWTIVKRLASVPHPLLRADVRERRAGLPAGLVSLTAAGREVALKRADHVALNGIDRWMGGTHLTSPRCWRWNGATLTIAD